MYLERLPKSKYIVYRPQLCGTKHRKVCGVRPEHECGDDLLLLAGQVVCWCTLDLVMLFPKYIQVVNLRKEALIALTIRSRTIHLEWGEVKL